MVDGPDLSRFQACSLLPQVYRGVVWPSGRISFSLESPLSSDSAKLELFEVPWKDLGEHELPLSAFSSHCFSRLPWKTANLPSTAEMWTRTQKWSKKRLRFSNLQSVNKLWIYGRGIRTVFSIGWGIEMFFRQMVHCCPFTLCTATTWFSSQQITVVRTVNGLDARDTLYIRQTRF